MNKAQSDKNEVTINNITRYQYKTLWASTIGYALDGLDMMLVAFCLPLLISYFNLSATEAGALSTVTLIGAVLGGITFGIAADRFGRIRVFSWTIIIFSVFTGFCALSPNYELLMLFRFLSGLGLGGEFGIGMTLVTEVWPKEYRSRATSIVALGFQLGIILAALSVFFISPYWGWRGVFFIGILPALFVAWIRKNLQEPSIWQALKRDHKNRISIHKLFYNRRVSLLTLGLMIATSVQNFGFYGIISWMPTMIAHEINDNFKDTALWTVSTISGMILGIIVFGWLCDKVGRRPAYLSFLIIASATIWFYFQQRDIAVIIVFGAVLGFFVNGMMGGFGALLAEHYPTEVRSTAENVIFNIGRAVAGFAPLIIGYVSQEYSLRYSLGLLSAIYILSALSFIFLIPESKDKELR